jgi:hypothetical protein
LCEESAVELGRFAQIPCVEPDVKTSEIADAANRLRASRWLLPSAFAPSHVSAATTPTPPVADLVLVTRLSRFPIKTPLILAVALLLGFPIATMQAGWIAEPDHARIQYSEQSDVGHATFDEALKE